MPDLKSTLPMIRQMRALLPWRNTFAMVSNFNQALPRPLHRWVSGGRRDYRTLPEVLKMRDGSSVTDPAAFYARRQEILHLFEEHVYGTLPKDGFQTSFEILEEGRITLDSVNALRRQIKLTITTDKGSSDAQMILYLPVADKKIPVVLGLNFHGNHTILDDPAILLSPATVLERASGNATSVLPDGMKIDPETAARLAKQNDPGGAAEQWSVREALAHGIGIASIYCNDFVPDGKDSYRSRVMGLFDRDHEPSYSWGAVGGWAFGLMRGLDYLVQDEQIDPDRLVVIGHSRLGKAALWAAAQDERVALILSNDAGCTGSSLSRGNRGETVKSIQAFFPYWFCPNYVQYGGHEASLPVDQHLLLASMAPRKVYVACAEGDLWSDPQGSWNSLMASRDAFSLHGFHVIDETMASHRKIPAADGSALFTESMGFHIRTGWHDVLAEDWKHYIDYMVKYL